MTEFFTLAHGQRAHRFLRSDPVPEAMIDQILDVATKAPSAQNTQPWEFVVVQDAATRAALAEHARLLWEASAREVSRPEVDTYQWSHTDAWATGAFARAPVIIVVCGDTNAMDVTRLGSSIFPAVQNILLAALDLGLGSLLATLPIVTVEGARRIVGLPDHLVPLASIPIGYPERTLKAPTRIPFKDKTHRDRYGTAW
jgi:nitroreductase